MPRPEELRRNLNLARGMDPFAANLYARLDPKRKLQFLSDEASIAGRNIFGAGGKLFGEGAEILRQPLAYYQGLLGSREEGLSAAAPDIKRIHGQYLTAAKAISEFIPRGGGKVTAASELPYTEAAEIEGLLERQRMQAAGGITEIAGLLSSLGLSEQQVGLREQALGFLGLEAVAGISQRQREQNLKLAKDAGEAAANILIALHGIGA